MPPVRLSQLIWNGAWISEESDLCSRGFRTMTNLRSLLCPDVVAVVGASDDPTRIGGRPLRYMLEAGFRGEIFPVNAVRETVQGLRAYASIGDLPVAPDVAILSVPANAVEKAVSDCCAKGVRAGIVFTSGFAEMGQEGAILQERIGHLAREAGMRLLGPNCLGAFNTAINFYGTFSSALDVSYFKSGPIGIVSQSGAYGAHIANLVRDRGLGLSQWITTGNECDIELGEALAHVVEMEDTRVIMAYAEGIRRRDSFISALERARELGKPVVFMKTGRSVVGTQAAASHTAALAGSDAVFDAVLRQFGVFRARTTTEHVDIAYACASGRYPAGNRVGVFTVSGGLGIQFVDDAEQAGLDVAPMPDEAQAKLKALLPFCSARNPVDGTAQSLNDLSILTNSVDAILELGGYDMLSVILSSIPATKTFAQPLKQALAKALEGHDDLVRGATMSAPREARELYENEGFLVFEDNAALATALGALVRFKENFDSARQRCLVRPGPRLELPAGPLSERAAKDILRQAGVSFPCEILVSSGEDAGAAAAKVGFPVVLKVSSPDIPHKTEVGGVVVGVKNAADAREAAAAILARAAQKAPGARIEGVLVAPMVNGGVETIVGVINDPSFGPVVMFGLGGVLVEVLKDVTFRVAPFDEIEAHRMIDELRGRALFGGVRGAPPSDVDALATLLSNLSRFAAAHSDRVQSIDLNPVLVRPKGEGVMPLDALIVTNDRVA